MKALSRQEDEQRPANWERWDSGRLIQKDIRAPF
jgi:hypothetical protein